MRPGYRANVETGPGCDVSSSADLENVVLHAGVTIRDGVQLKNVEVGPHTRLSREVTLYSPDPERPVRVGAYCWLSFQVFAEGTGAEVFIGDHSVIAHRSTLLTGSGPGAACPILHRLYPEILEPIRIDGHCWIGAHTVVLPGVRLPEGVVVGANSTLREGEYQSWCLYGGSPARLLRELDREAVRRARNEWLEGEA